MIEADTGERNPAAEWILSTTGDGTWTLVNVATGRLLEVGGQARHCHNDGARGELQPHEAHHEHSQGQQ